MNGETRLIKQGYYSESGTVLKRKDSGRGGKMLLLFLRNMGRVWVSAPAASSKNRFGGACEPLVWSVFKLYKSSNFLYLKSAEIKEDFLSFRTKPKKLIAAFGLYKQISELSFGEQDNEKLLNLLWSCMKLIEADCPAEAVRLRFNWRLLNYLGISPSLVSCVDCSKKLDANWAWLCEDGFVCSDCRGQNQERVSAEELKLLQFAAMLSHEKFKSWVSNIEDASIFSKYCDFLMSFFKNID